MFYVIVKSADRPLVIIIIIIIIISRSAIRDDKSTAKFDSSVTTVDIHHFE
jgi:hypothetical protein